MRAVLRFCRLAAIVLLVGFGAGFFAFVASLREFSGEAAPGEAQGIVALTGGTQRISDAIDLLARGYGERLLISGVNATTTRAEIAKLNPGQLSLLECCVDLDRRARNTIGNAIETRRWVSEREFKSIIVVTSNYHMPRTMLELDNAMPGVRKIPHAVSPSGVDIENWWRDPVAARLLAQEYVKYLTVWARTRMESDPELSRLADFFLRDKAWRMDEARRAVPPAAIPD
ncbi:MAG: YdcF family protein [Salinarimonadaceae bacterium]|nr:MAG: YdcF family protein [Salinarimonadaceae bacterium]